MRQTMERVILLNSDYSYLNTISWKTAMKLLFKGKVEMLKATNRILKSIEGKWTVVVPAVLRLIKLVRTVYKTRVPFSKRNVVQRDLFTCQYCGHKEKKMTIDHVVPISRGGKTTFENCVAACKPCNNTKGDRTPNEANMTLRKQPHQPTIMEFLTLRMKALGIDEVLRDLGVY